MGCGNTCIATLAGFLDIPVLYMKGVVVVMWPVQIVKKEESEMDALLDELQRHMDHNDRMTHQRSIEGHEHPPFSLIKSSYGK